MQTIEAKRQGKYYAGYWAAFDGAAFDANETPEWKSGWRAQHGKPATPDIRFGGRKILADVYTGQTPCNEYRRLIVEGDRPVTETDASIYAVRAGYFGGRLADGGSVAENGNRVVYVVVYKD